jgi:hypothetical protein
MMKNPAYASVDSRVVPGGSEEPAICFTLASAHEGYRAGLVEGQKPAAGDGGPDRLRLHDQRMGSG